MHVADTRTQTRLAGLRRYLSHTKARVRGTRFHSIQGLGRELQKFVDFDNGACVEAGAIDGAMQSNTLDLERYRGWRDVRAELSPSDVLYQAR